MSTAVMSFGGSGAGNGAAESDGRDDVRNGRHAATTPALRDVGDRVDCDV